MSPTPTRRARAFRTAGVCLVVALLSSERLHADRLNITVSVLDYGAVGDGVADDSAAIQAALDGAFNVYFPSGKYFIGTTTLQTVRGHTLYGISYTGTRILYAGTGDAIHYSTGRINFSGGGQFTVRDVQIVGTNPLNQGAGIDVVAGGFAFFDIDRVRVTADFKYGVIFDQAEIAHVRESIIDNGVRIPNSVNVWITNGDEHTAGMAVGFSNVVQLRDNQLNAAAVGVMDDGGNNHTIESNNFNGHKIPLRVAGTSSIQIKGNTFETQRIDGEANVLFTTTAGVAGGTVPNKGPSEGGVVEGNTFAGSVGPGASSMLKFTAANPAVFHSAFTISANHFEFHYGRGAAIDVTQLRNSFSGFNQDDAGTQYNHYAGVHMDGFANTLLLPARGSDTANPFVPVGAICPEPADTGAGGASITAPPPGARLMSSSLTLEWSAAIGAHNYWLDVGSTPGGSDLYSADQRLSTTRTVTLLPIDGRTIYVRLRTLLTGRWALRDYSYAAAGPPVPAGMVSPTAGTTLTSTFATFRWTSGQSVSQIWLDVGRTLGASQIYGASQQTATSATIGGLPGDGSAVYVRLWSLTSGGWGFTDYTYVATTLTAVPVSLVTPSSGTTLSGQSATFGWTSQAGVAQIWLDVGTSPGGHEIFTGSQGLALSRTVAGLPTGTTIYVRLWSLAAGRWTYSDYSFRTA